MKTASNYTRKGMLRHYKPGGRHTLGYPVKHSRSGMCQNICKHQTLNRKFIVFLCIVPVEPSRKGESVVLHASRLAQRASLYQGRPFTYLSSTSRLFKSCLLYTSRCV